MKKLNLEINKAISLLDNKKFAYTMLEEMQKIFSDSLPISFYEFYGSGTAGWNVAFYSACKRMNLLNVYSVYYKLDWQDSDKFDDKIEQILVKHKMFYNGDVYSLIEGKYKILEDNIVHCWECGKFMDKSQGYIENDGFFHCNDCTTSKGYDISMKNFDLNIPESKCFKCEKCGDTYLKAAKGKKYCIHCEGDKSYYLKRLKELEEFEKELDRQ